MKTKKKICYNCQNNNFNLKKATVKNKVADWKKNIGIVTKYPNDIEMPLKISYPKKYNTIYKLQLDKIHANKYVYYYAANTKEIDEILKPKFSVNAYGKNFENRGVCKVDKNGLAKLKLDCPQSYYVKEKEQYVSHIHYLISDKENKKWVNKLYTERIICNISKNDLSTLILTRKALVLNALPFEEYIKKRIPNSISLPYDLVTKNKISKDDIYKYIKDMLTQYQPINKLVKNGKLKIENIPIIIYCYNKSCNASNLLIDKLVEYGFTDIKEYPYGIKGWFN